MLHIPTKFSQILFFAFCLLLSLPKQIHASDFETRALINYDIENDGVAKVTYDITIENTSDASLSKGYVLSLSHITPEEITANEDGLSLLPNVSSNENDTTITLQFQKPVNGKGKKKRVTISFITKTIAQKSGGIWEVIIPKITRASDFQNYSIHFSIPKEFGEEAYVTPKKGEVREDNNKRIYHFNKESLKENGISATFGNFQVFSFDLTYHLENTSWKKETQEIALPPSTGTQKIYLERIDPMPEEIRVDEDGNWIAQFSLWPLQAINPKVQGQAQVFTGIRKSVSSNSTFFKENTKQTTYWQTDNHKIQELAKSLKTPENIYNHVVTTLSYNYERVNGNVERHGAVFALENPDDAICMEFTDLFIAIARAAGIPAREVNGFAYSDNPRIQPLALVSDVLHSWPEYWNSDREVWIPIDPTWAKTTGGQDFFNTFDLRHVAFVIHGKDDTDPKPAGSYKQENNSQKDVYVTLDTLRDTPNIEVPYKTKTFNWKLYGALILSTLSLISGIFILLYSHSRGGGL